MENRSGFIPPNASDVEQSIIGAMLLDKKAVDEVVAILKTSEVFYKPEHQQIYEAVREMYFASLSIDLVTVSDKLRQMGKLDFVGGFDYLISLTQKIASSAHIDYHSRIVLQYYIKRKTASIAQTVTAKAYDDGTDVFDLLRMWSNEMDLLQQSAVSGNRELTMAEGMKDLQKRIERLSHAVENTLTGVHTGFKRINDYTGGYQSGDLVILAARPGMGKTSKVLKTVVENAKVGNAVGFISLEMSFQQLLSRVVAIDTNFHLKQLLKTGFEKPEYFTRLMQHGERIGGYPIYIDDGTASDISDIILKARSWKRKHDIKLLVVDYLQLVSDTTKKGNRENEVSSVSRKLKLLAKELQIPVIVLSQLSRQVETRGSSKRPLLSDLRESGSIEQDADIVEFIYRPEYYNIEISNHPEYEEMVQQGADTEIIFAKYRAGGIGTSYLKWVGDKTKFIDPTDHTDTQHERPEQPYAYPPVPPNKNVDESIF